MKKFMMAAVALICMTMTSVALSSCGDDDDDKGNDGSQFSTAVLDFTLITSDETLAVFDVTAEYYDNGKLQSEKLTQSTFKKTVKAALPANLGARLFFNVKSGVDVASLEKVEATYGYEYSTWCESANGAKGKIVIKEDLKHASLSGDRVEAWLAKNSDLIKFGYDYTANGEIVNTGWK